MAKKSGIGPGMILALAAPIAGAILWIALGEPGEETKNFLNRVSALTPEQAVGYTGAAQAYAEACPYGYNPDTDAMVYKASGLRRSKLAKDPNLRQAYAESYESTKQAGTVGRLEDHCLAGYLAFGENGEKIPGLLRAED